MADNEFYVDPSLNSASGAGTIGDPWGDLEHALAQVAMAAGTNRINIKSGTAEVLAATLDFSTNWTPTGTTNPVHVEGYTSTAGDGGRATIDGATAGVQCVSGADLPSFVIFKNIDFTGGTSTLPCVELDKKAVMYRCTVSAYNRGISSINGECNIIGCYVEYGVGGSGGYGIEYDGANGMMLIYGNYVKALDAGSQDAITVETGTMLFNIVDLRATAANGAHGFTQGQSRFICINNTIIGGSGDDCYGINFLPSGAHTNPLIANNYIEGFTGTGSYPIRPGRTQYGAILASNRWYNCANSPTFNFPFEIDRGGNQAIGSSGLVDLASNDFTPNSNLIGLASPSSWRGLAGHTNYLDIGAIQVAH